MFLFSNVFGRKKLFGQLARTWFWTNGKPFYGRSLCQDTSTELRLTERAARLCRARYNKIGKSLANLPIVESCPSRDTRNALDTHTCKSSNIGEKFVLLLRSLHSVVNAVQLSHFCLQAAVAQPAVTRFDQSECVICRVIFALGRSRFQRYMWRNFRFIPSLSW